MSTASQLFGDDLALIAESVSSDLNQAPGGTVDYTPSASATPCGLAFSIAIMC